MRSFKFIPLPLVAVLLLSACSKNKSETTGWKYNNSKWGGFERAKFTEQETGPGLVFIEGGSFIMGQHEQDLTYDHNNVKRTISVPSFYMDETEVSNFHYLEYLYWLLRVHVSNPQIYTGALPDTLVWRNKLSYNEPHVLYYLRHPAYRDYPVVGVSWLQAVEYTKWRTDRVNEMILVREGLVNLDVKKSVDDNNFNTEAYLLGLYTPNVKKQLKDYHPDGKKRDVRMEDGILLPDYRLPTEAEWEYAARGGLENAAYPWGGPYLMDDRGCYLANFKPKRGNYIEDEKKGTYPYTAPVKKFRKNGFGLYDMAGNVSEWTESPFNNATYQFSSTLNPYLSNQAYREAKKSVRGGSWKDVGYLLMTGYRDWERKDSARSYIGFRTIQDVPAGTVKLRKTSK